MKKKKIIILIAVSVLFVTLLVLFIIDIKKDITKIDDKKIIDNSTIKTASRVNKNDNDNNDISDDTENNIDDKGSNKEKEDYNGDDVVDYFENGYNDIVKNGSNIKEKAKEYFIDVVDFIFYDKEIKGYTFDEISNMTKIKVIAIALKIDSKIDEYFPGYKETISENGNKVYSNVKERLVTSYLDLSVKICSNNENECVKAKEIFSDVKDNCKIGWDFIKKLVTSGGNKIKEWYEIYSGKR